MLRCPFPESVSEPADVALRRSTPTFWLCQETPPAELLEEELEELNELDNALLDAEELTTEDELEEDAAELAADDAAELVGTLEAAELAADE